MTFEQFGRILIKRWSLVVICCLLVGLGAFIGQQAYETALSIDGRHGGCHSFRG